MARDHHSAAPQEAATREPNQRQLRDAWRRPQQWALDLAGSRIGLWLIGVASFLETIIVPIPKQAQHLPVPSLTMRVTLTGPAPSPAYMPAPLPCWLRC
ncbi:hypothetical protein [Thiohalocapsa sp. ML1]|uniref:hypothetical protein n=1 Tax=Thiohalocapsa sp. ML1 TaxID=1431688 RepID=UPI000731F359|nr:hypothetical protein [Thiohalocapsa sp. ML1]